uniref:Uncharacterized protein n=1 Tax=Anopheles maculatus TaxID=74869 RepID=A0A182STJ5_9DIPT
PPHHHPDAQQPRFHQQNIKVINLSESQRNHRQYFADTGRQPRPRQLRYTGPETGAARGDGGGRSVKKSSLSENRTPGGSQRAASAKHSAKDNAKDKKHNLLESVTLVSSSSRDGSSSNSSKNSRNSGTSTSKGTHPPRNCTAATFGPVPPGCTPSGRDWTGGQRIVLQQNGLALTSHPTGGKGPKASRGKGHTAVSTFIPPTTRRHHRKDGPARGNQTMNERTHRKPSTAAPFVAFGKPKLLRVPRVGRKQNGTAVRVPRREPNYLDDVFFIENYHQQQRRNRKHQSLPMEDFWGNEIMVR